MPRAAASPDLPAATEPPGSILVIDDEEIMREILEALLTREGYNVRLAANAAKVLDLVRSVPFDAAIVDMMMPGMDGISTLDELKKIDDELPVLMITAFASVENAITAMKRGRLRLHHQAVQERRSARRAAQRARAAASRRREPRAPAEPAGPVEPLRRDHRPQLADAAGLRSDHPGRRRAARPS
jgi:DNA-binding NtrC family response regulator